MVSFQGSLRAIPGFHSLDSRSRWILEPLLEVTDAYEPRDQFTHPKFNNLIEVHYTFEYPKH
jgi:hypothetical protein